MKRILILTAAAAVVFASCGKGTASLKTQEDSVAYAIGLTWGKSLRSIDSTLNVNVFSSAVKSVMDNKEPAFSEEECNNIVMGYFTITKPAKNKEASEKFLAEVEKNNKNVKKTESGLLYEIIEPGSDVKAVDPADIVKVKYVGTRKNGTQFDASQEGDTVQFALNSVIPGWAEGIKLIGKGGKIKLWIPSDLAYGQQGYPQVIDPNEAIVFDVELYDVVPVDSVANPANPNYKAPAQEK